MTASQAVNITALRIVFGHQSVGGNVLQGLAELGMEPAPRVVEGTRSDQLATPGLLHFALGRNGDTGSKLGAWRQALSQGLGATADVALMKFCYDDVSHETNAARLFTDYHLMVEEIARSYPRLAVVHVTIPLTTVQSGPKALIKRLLGRPVYGERENARREEFNDRMREAYPSDQIFDIAQAESIGSGGNPATFVTDGRTIRQLAPELTDDGGHLNSAGRRLVALQLLAALGRAASRG